MERIKHVSRALVASSIRSHTWLASGIESVRAQGTLDQTIAP